VAWVKLVWDLHYKIVAFVVAANLVGFGFVFKEDFHGPRRWIAAAFVAQNLIVVLGAARLARYTGHQAQHLRDLLEQLHPQLVGEEDRSA